ncbi:MAG TPA: family 10 glycosylhydrolase [Planctomycetes bacterium]|nr:family 10 glycosylhydrolase [Planctomycetota bacterium]
MSIKLTAVLVVACVAQSVAIAGPVPLIPETAYEIIDDLSYSEATAQTSWRPMTGSKSVSLVEIEGKKALKMPCNFYGTKFDRSSWDRELKLDLTMCKGVQFLFYCHDASSIGSFRVYFHSGDGWYRGKFAAPASAGWTVVKIHKNSTDIEGRPAGWSKVDTIRISAWRGQDVDTAFYITALGLFGSGGKIIVVRGDSVANEIPNELKAVKQYANIMARFLDRVGLSHIVLSDLDVTEERLKGIKLMILPYNPKMPDKVAERIAKFLQAGGKLITCYTLPRRFEAIVGIRVGPHIRQKYQGYFASIRTCDEGLHGMPAVTEQVSWNINDVSAVDGRSRIAALWYSNNGQSTGEPAVVISENCIYLTHVLLSDDSANKVQLLLAMIGNLVPELWREAVRGCLDRIGRFGPYTEYNSSKQGVEKIISKGSPAGLALDRAAGLRKRGLALLSEGNFSKAIAAAEKAQESMIEAYCLAQKPLQGEHRAFWCHSAFGVAGMTWDRAIELLAENGFTAILPNMLWGGAAFYNSEVLPVAAAVKEKGDQIDLCLTACKKYGIKCHIWKVNYNMGWATDKKYIARMKAKGRTQVNYDGSSNERWLCPSHPDNQKLEIESMLEVAGKYDVDGLHFDYIRYPGKDGCFCKGCRLRFEKSIGRKINNWPTDLRNNESLNEKWLDFRRRQITTVVAAVAQRAKKIRPDIKVSAAVFRNWPVDRNSVGQDWKLWCDRGFLDFVCPMDYTDSGSHFENMIGQQLEWAGNVPCYPGIGLSVWSSSSDICKLIEHINITRRLGTGGFTIFNYGPTETNEVLPLLGKGITRKR